MTRLRHSLFLLRREKALLLAGQPEAAAAARARLDELDLRNGFRRRPNSEPVMQPGQEYATSRRSSR